MENYKDIFKSWYFWISIVVLSLFQAISFVSIYGEVFFSEIMGIFLGAFISMLIFFSIIFFVGRLIKQLRKKKK